MNNYKPSKIRRYEIFLRKIINQVVEKFDYEKLDKQNKSFSEKAKERFAFDNNRNWSFLTSSLDTLGDAQFAIVHFSNDKIQNDRFLNTGENYLRMYGVLSAIYIHQQAIINLSSIFKVENVNSIKQQYRNLKISFLRNSIAAHPLNFEKNGQKTNYKIARYSITDRGKLVIVDEKNNSTELDIFKSIEEYLKIAEFHLEQIIQKVIKTVYKSSSEKITKTLEDFEEVKNLNNDNN